MTKLFRRLARAPQHAPQDAGAGRSAALIAALALGLGACTAEAPPPDPAAPLRAGAGADSAAIPTEEKIAAVATALSALGPGVDPAEAQRAASIAVRGPLQWARDWQVVDPPLVHNFKVVNGLREKGVCQDWADALEIALHAEGFRTLDLHRAIANARNLSLEHATLVVSASGQPMQTGLILDPWRIGQGRLWFARVTEDPRYRWETRAEVRAWHAEWKARARARQQ